VTSVPLPLFGSVREQIHFCTKLIVIVGGCYTEWLRVNVNLFLFIEKMQM
jgi:hypothetical protein